MDDETISSLFETFTEIQKDFIYEVIGIILDGEAPQEPEKYIDFIKNFTRSQRIVFFFLVGLASMEDN